MQNNPASIVAGSKGFIVKVFFVRHGESTGNAGIPSFDLSKLELTPLGHAQAKSTALGWPQRPTLIAMSPYLRTHLTAQPTIDRFPDVPVEILPMEEFTYLEPSRWNGTSRQVRLPHIESYWGSADPEFCDGPGAESFQTLLDRVGRTLARFEGLPSDALVYAFSHGQSFRRFVRACCIRAGQRSRRWPTSGPSTPGIPS
ncbi:histidine phosphatase family protein [Variovorax ginsengisoli]|uniref:Broad specificity phosphatase PhoE n=1 Tax=Variovorax ginsengisoli TaxID=363844 RepID=A0ABT9S8N8_9BURK|nr:histidine phosphatase family protein [Variovorax ginsengisoli]MDP9900718.1 broad specificity phosphatase PhoE [Variovorax ginsengisoli]